MGEKINLATAYKPDPRSAADLLVEKVTFDIKDKQLIVVVGDSAVTVRREFVYRGDIAIAKMKALNKANLTTKSLDRRLLEGLQVDFPELAGSIAGTPD